MTPFDPPDKDSVRARAAVAHDDDAQPVKRERRYDIDWLRVILFGLLLPFHVAIGVYVDAYDFVLPDYDEDEDKRTTYENYRMFNTILNRIVFKLQFLQSLPRKL